MDPTMLVMAAAAYVGSCVAHKCTTATIDTAWNHIAATVRRKLGKETDPARPDAGAITAIASSPDEVLMHDAMQVFEHTSALRRARVAEAALKNARILWIDDNPMNNECERALLSSFGARVEPRERSASAFAELQRAPYDLVISDIERDGVSDEGVRFLAHCQRIAEVPPVVFYVGTVDPDRDRPFGSWGITWRPDELLHLVLDVLERRRL